jgi:cell pole-organizing protein PopZ
MSKPEAGTRNLEEILSSIRKTLANETVDGLVELSAAAAAAARAEAQAAADASAAAAAQTTGNDDALSGKLAGALNGDDHAAAGEEDDLSDLFAEPKLPPLSIPKAGAEPDAASSPNKDALWFLRPGAPDTPAPTATPAPRFGEGPVLEMPMPAAAPSEPTKAEAPKSEAPAKRDSLQTEPTKASVLPAETSEPPAAKTTEAGEVSLTRPESVRASFPPLFGASAAQRKPVVSAPAERPMPAAWRSDPTPPMAPEPKMPEARPPEPPTARDTVQISEPEPAAIAKPAPAAAESAATMFFKPAPASAATKAGPPADLKPPVPPPAIPAVTGSAADAEAVRDGGAEADKPSAPNGPLEDMIAALLEPVMQKLLDKNLKPLIEVAVREQIAAIALSAERDRGKG